MQVGDFNLVNDDKVRRVLDGETDSKGKLVQGLGEDAIEEDPDAVIAAYDKLGGLIRGEEGAKVKTGCFFDFKNGVPFKNPKVVYEFLINGERVDLDADEEPTLEMKAAKKAKAGKAGKKGGVKVKKVKGRDPEAPDEEVETTDLEKEGE